MNQPVALSIMRKISLAVVLLVSNAAVAQVAGDVIPGGAPNCTVENPPAESGLAATPGGFVMVFPRNDALTRQYTGCKLMWLVNGERRQKFATLYFKAGKLAVAAAHNVRDAAGLLDAACAFPAGKSLLPNTGRQIKDSGCANMPKEAFYQLYLPTWPTSCLNDAEAAVCQQEPR
jgi:hypothetical protein